MKKTKTFDCVETKHRGAEELQKKTAKMSLEEELAFWRERTQTLREHQKKAKETHATDSGN